jgi:hypothetical protein
MATRMLQRRGTAAQWANANPILGSGEIGFETDTGQFKIGDQTTHWDDLPYFKNIEDLGGNLDDYILLTQKGEANGVATLNNLVVVPDEQISLDIARTSQLSASYNYVYQQLENINEDLTFKVYDAITSSNFYTDEKLSQIANLAPSVLDTLGEIATSLNNDPNFYSSISDSIIDSIAVSASYANGILLSYSNTVDDELLNVNNEINSVSQQLISNSASLNLRIDQNAVSAGSYSYQLFQAEESARNTQVLGAINSLELDASTKVNNHNLETLNVHGISNTATLVTLTQLNNHESDTSNVHGITNTLAVVLTDDARLSDARTPLNNSVTNNSISGTIDQNKITNLATTLGNLASLAGADFTGNVTIDQDLTVDGNFIVNGSNVVVSATQLQIEDTLLQLGHENANNVSDMGMVVSYNDGTQKHSGFVKDATDGKWKLFDGVTTEPATTVNFGQGSLDVLALLTLEANSITATSDITANGIVFADGTQRLEGVPSRTPIIQKTASYTLSALTERDDLIEIDSVSATTLTIPLNSAVAFPVGTSIDILQTNTGQVTIAGDAGVTVNATPGLKLRTRWSSCTLFKRATNTWVVYGDLTA